MKLNVTLSALLTVVCLTVVCLAGTVMAADYYVDSNAGNDGNAGTSSAAAWRSLVRVNETKLAPGDRVMFRRGCVWRGQIIAQPGSAGKPIVYTAFGEGDKPLILGSVSLTDPAAWIRSSAGEGLWETRGDRVLARTNIPDFEKIDWYCYTEKPAIVHRKTTKPGGEKCLTFVCERTGTAGSHIQLSPKDAFTVTAGEAFAFRFKAKSTVPFVSTSFCVIKKPYPWTRYGSAKVSSLEFTPEWKEYEIVFNMVRSGDDSRLVFFLGSELPTGAEFSFVPLGAYKAQIDSLGINVDVGNIVLKKKGSDLEYAAFKRWKVEELKEQDDFLYDRDRSVVVYKSSVNPATLFSEMEAALYRHGVSSTHDVVIDGLHLSRHAGHGVGGGGQSRVVVRNCDISWIGGGHLYTRNGVCTRFGNGVEFWAGASDNIVENNRFWEVYDVAMSNQGRELCTVENVIWRNNTIYNCEQTYEIWFTDPNTKVKGLVFEHNTSVDAGFGWSHRQRPDKRATHLLSYNLMPTVFDFVFRKNVFCNSLTNGIWFANSRAPEFKIDDNVWWQPEKDGKSGKDTLLFRWAGAPGGKAYEVAYEKYREITGNDRTSRFVQPKFADPAHRDYRIVNRDEIGDAGVVGQ